MTAVAASAAPARRFLMARVGLALVAIPQAEIGVWGLLAPHSFYRSFPGAGHHWVSVLGTYNEHLVRDYAAAELGFAVLLIAAAGWFQRTLVLAAGAAFIAATLPHFLYHLTTTDHLSTGDNLASLGGFAVEMLVVVAAMAVALRMPERNRYAAP
jgi:hypothetical protein